MIEEIKIGTHFWAKMDGKLVMMIRAKDHSFRGEKHEQYFVCGGWEGAFSPHEFELIETVNFPKGYGKNNLYYLNA